MLELHEMIRVSHVVRWSIVFILFLSKVGKEKCSKL